MEHKLIQGGEQFLPFARSRIKALRATGLKYASQKFEIDGVSVKVRIAGEHEYIELSGGEKNIVYLLFLPIRQGTGLPRAAWEYRQELFEDHAPWVFIDADVTPIILEISLDSGKVKKVSKDFKPYRNEQVSFSESIVSAGTVPDGYDRSGEALSRAVQDSSGSRTFDRYQVASFYSGAPVYLHREESHTSTSHIEGPSLLPFNPGNYTTYPGMDPGAWKVFLESTGSGGSSSTLIKYSVRWGKGTLLAGSSQATGTNTLRVLYSSDAINAGSEFSLLQQETDKSSTTLVVSDRIEQQFTSSWSAVIFDSSSGVYQGTTDGTRNTGSSNIADKNINIRLPKPAAKYGPVLMHDVARVPAKIGVSLLDSARPLDRHLVDFDHRSVSVQGNIVKTVSLDTLLSGANPCYGLGSMPVYSLKYTDTSPAKELFLGALSTKALYVSSMGQVTNYAPNPQTPPKERTRFTVGPAAVEVLPVGVTPSHVCLSGDLVVAARHDYADESCFWLHVYPKEPITPPGSMVPQDHPKYEGQNMNILRSKLFTNSTASLPEKLTDATILKTPMLPPGYVLAGIKRDEADCLVSARVNN